MTRPGPTDHPLLSLRAISVRFGSLQALSKVSLDLDRGEVRAILGENGAGKSTLMNAVYGLVPADGEIHWHGQRVRIDTPLDARRLGIGMVHQEFALIDALSVVENLALADGASSALIDYDEVRAHAKRRADELGLDIGDIDHRVGDLPVGVRQRIEILRAAMKEVELLILDEPTAVLTPGEIEHLFTVLRSIRERGVAILLITHKLSEVTDIADTVSVLRHGELVAHRLISQTDEHELAGLMVGGELATPPPPAARKISSSATLRVADLMLHDRDGALRLDGLALEVRGGETLGIAGVDGNGQKELFEVLSGLRCPSRGSITVDGVRPKRHDPSTLGAAGVSLIPPERRRDGAVLEMPVWENAILDQQLLEQYSTGQRLDRARARSFASDVIDRYRIVCDGPDASTMSLSGGNLQKLIVGRALARRPRLVLAFNPTRGLDVGAAQAVYTALRQVLEWGGSILLISTDLDEILSLSDRISVLYRGNLSPPLAPPFDRTTIGEMMGGNMSRTTGRTTGGGSSPDAPARTT